LRSIVRASLLFVFVSAAAHAVTTNPAPDVVSSLNEVVVTGTYRPSAQIDVPASVSVLDSATLREAGQQHLEDVLALVPNLNWAGDTSRPRYFQIRGIGELEQYQGAPNPSVGVLIDDIDFSGLGSAATLFDVDHIEVLRGPQGLRYGANALGGLKYAQSAEPAETADRHVELSAGNDGERDYGAVLTGPVPALDSSFRLAAQHYTSNGYYRDVYLNRNDTNRREKKTKQKQRHNQPTKQKQDNQNKQHDQNNKKKDTNTQDNTRNTQ